MDGREPLLAGQAVDERHPVGDGLAGLNHAGAIAVRVGDLDEGRVVGHHDRTRDPQPGGVIRKGLGVIPGAGRNDTPLAGGRAETPKLVERSPVLERSGALPELGFEMEPSVGARLEGEGLRAGGPHHLGPDPFAGRDDI